MFNTRDNKTGRLREELAQLQQAFKQTQDALYTTQKLFFDSEDRIRRYQLALLNLGRNPPPPQHSRDLTPSITFNAVPKTAGLYIYQTLARGLGYDNVEICLNIFPGATIDHRMLGIFLKGNCICHHHLEATDINLWYLARHQMPVTLHIRDLRSVMLSWVHHLTATGTAEAMGGHPVIAPTQEFFERPFEWRMDWVLETQLPVFVAFMDGWLKAHDSGKIRLLITTFEDFRRDSEEFFGRILDFFNIPRANFKNPELEKARSLNFRSGNPDEWRSVMTQGQIAKVVQSVPDDWWTRFGWSMPA